jgi:hypothetical protein
MATLAEAAALAAALATIAQPCAAAAATKAPSTSLVTDAPSANAAFDLSRRAAGSNVQGDPALQMASLSLAASRQTAAETPEPPRKRGPGTTTLLIVGGVLLLVLVAAAVASATPTPGPNEGAFD